MLHQACHGVFHRMLFAVILLSCLLASSLYYRSTLNSIFHIGERVRPGQKQTVLLIWHWPFNSSFNLDSCESRFQIHACHLTTERSLYSRADGVLFHHRDIEWDLSNLPTSPRPPRQKWIWMNSESPSNSAQIPGLQNLFNVSLSYRQDADISVPYGSIVLTGQEVEDFEPPRKSRLVCWIVSNWKPEHARVRYFIQLHLHVQIHTFGDYFDRHLSDHDYMDVLASCKFYLSFENSLHKDYITEKLYNALMLGTVPIVFGPPRKNYESFIPRDAFIHVEDFPSMSALAKHLRLLDRNDRRYRRYFNWRKHFEAKISDFPVEHACYACDYVKRHQQYQVLSNLYQWFWEAYEGLDLPAAP